jgi:hypothetical protein
MGIQENSRTIFALFPQSFTLREVEGKMSELRRKYFSEIYV